MEGQAKVVNTLRRYRFDPAENGRWVVWIEFVEHYISSQSMREHIWAERRLGTVDGKTKRKMEDRKWA